MDDIFLDDPRQSSAQNIARSQKDKKKPKRRLREYFADLFIKSLLLAVLLCLDFTLFAEAGSYNLFTAEQSLTPEAAWIYTAIAAFSFAVLFLFSFSLTLQNFIIALASAFLLLTIFNQFALFDQTSLLATYLGTTRMAGAADVFNNYSHLVIAAFLLIVVFIFLSFAKRSSQTYLLGTLLLIWGGLMSEAYFNPVSRAFDTKSALNDESTHPDSRNFIFIGLQNAPSYFKLKTFDKDGKNAAVKQAADNILGFYQQNNFTYYPYAYVSHTRNPYLNMAESLNPESYKAPEDLLLSNVIMNRYWNFKNLNNERIYLRSNRLFDIFHKKDYNLRIYQGQGIELCSINSRLSVNSCVEKVGLPINLSELPFSLPQKTALLAAQWLESTGFIPGIDSLLGIASAFSRNVAPLHFSAKQLKSYNAFKTLDLIAEDIVEDRGNNAYFTVIDFPGNLFIYDSLCNLKPVSRWISAQDQSTGLSERHKALAEQTDCLYGQLENFMQKLQKSGKLKHTTIIIQGLDVPFPAMPGLEKNLFKSFQSNKQTGIAVYDPLKNQTDIDYRMCPTPAVINSSLNKKACTELENFATTDKLKTEMLTDARKQKLDNRQIEAARTAFKKWYASWAADNQVENIMEEEVIPLEKLPGSPEIIPEKEIKEVPVTEAAEELPPETRPQTLSEAAAEIESAENKQPAEPTASADNNRSAEKSARTDESQPSESKQTDKPVSSADTPQTEENTAAETDTHTPMQTQPGISGSENKLRPDEHKETVSSSDKPAESITPPVEGQPAAPSKEEAAKTKTSAVPAKETAPKAVSQVKAAKPEKTSSQTTPSQALRKKAASPQSEQKTKATSTQKTKTEPSPETKEKPLPKPEQLKKKFKEKQAETKAKTAAADKNNNGDKAKVSVEVKVIDQSAGNDVVPPFLLGELKYKPAADTENEE